VELQVDMTT